MKELSAAGSLLNLFNGDLKVPPPCEGVNSDKFLIVITERS